VLLPLADPSGSLGAMTVTAAAGRAPFDMADVTAAASVAERLAAAVSTGRLMETLAYRSDHDGLTGLPNRGAVRQHLTAVLGERRHRGDGDVVVVFVDIDRFKAINDGLGHAVGDEVLRAVGRHLCDVVRANDMVGRFGGDEFAVVLRDSGAPEERAALVDRIAAPVETGVQAAGQELVVSLSAGVAAAAPGDSDETLLRHADAAMYLAKRSRGGNWRTFGRAMLEEAALAVRRENDLRHAIDKGQLFCEYQPILDTQSGSFVAYEALLRWHHPDLGTIAPGSFIPLGEATGLIHPLGQRVLDLALASAARWDPDTSVSVNVSPLQLLAPDFPASVLASLVRHGVAPARLILEVTETEVISDLPLSVTALDRLHDEGIRIAVDDFGTGLTSIAYFETMPIDIMKIDSSFVMGSMSGHSTALLGALIHLASALGVEAVVEGVETTAMCEAAVDQGATLLQGFDVGRPGLGPERQVLSVAAGLRG
jgi:diguanylate cyclase (GGDEF)-like protein